ncbi:MAG TPA: pitrilysin family protein [Ignavibacteriaceae bacterium]|nr:pitrilysin family protein [Ignavibacteriaceae bacterium]
MKSFLISILLLMTTIKAQDVVELKTPGSGKIIIKLIFFNGSKNDPPGKEGITYTTASLIIQGGTGTLSYSGIQDKIYPWAASYSSSVDKEVTIFTYAVHKDWLKDFYPIVRGLILEPSFSESDFKRVKVNQQNYVDQVIRASSDEDYSKVVLEDLLFKGTNYQHMVQGKSASVNSITLEDVKNYYKKNFTKNNLLIGIEGDYTGDFLDQLKKDMSRLPDLKPEIPPSPKIHIAEGIKVLIVSKKGAFGSAIYTGYPISITRADDEFAALMIANSYLGEHRKSYGRLYQQLRETRSMNYGDYSYIEWYERGGNNMLPPSGVPRSSNYFSIWIRPVQIAKQLREQYPELSNIKIGHAHFALRMALREVQKLVDKGMTPDDFESTRSFLKSYIKLYVRTPNEQLGYLMDSKFYGRKDYVSELEKLLDKVTLQDVNAAIKKYFQIKNMDMAIVTDESEAENLAESLRKNLDSPMSYSNLVKEGLTEEVLKEDSETENFKLNIKSVEVVKSEDTFK